MDIRQLGHFVALMELGTVHAAAANQSISQPGLSSSIKRLEKNLGTVLFVREGWGMQPTAEGQRLYRHAKHILEQLRLARAELDGPPSTLHIGLGETRPSDFVAVLTEGLLERYPNVVPSFVEEHFDALYAQVENGEVDVAFVATPAENAPVTLQRHILARNVWRVVCAAGHPLAQERGPIPISALDGYSWVRNAAAPAISPFLPQFEGYNKSPLDNVRVITAGSQQTAKQLVIHSDVLGYGPELVWDVERAHGLIVELDLPITDLFVSFSEVRRRDTHSAVLDAAFAISEKYFEDRGR